MFTEKEVRELCEKMFMEGRLFEKANYQPMSIPQAIDYYFKKFIDQHSARADDVYCRCEIRYINNDGTCRICGRVI